MFFLSIDLISIMLIHFMHVIGERVTPVQRFVRESNHLPSHPSHQNVVDFTDIVSSGANTNEGMIVNLVALLIDFILCFLS